MRASSTDPRSHVLNRTALLQIAKLPLFSTSLQNLTVNCGKISTVCQLSSIVIWLKRVRSLRHQTCIYLYISLRLMPLQDTLTVSCCVLNRLVIHTNTVSACKDFVPVSNMKLFAASVCWNYQCNWIKNNNNEAKWTSHRWTCNACQCQRL